MADIISTRVPASGSRQRARQSLSWREEKSNASRCPIGNVGLQQKERSSRAASSSCPRVTKSTDTVRGSSSPQEVATTSSRGRDRAPSAPSRFDIPLHRELQLT